MHRLAIVIVLLSSACAEDPVIPETGRWSYAETRTTENTCGQTAISVSGDFEIVRADENGFRVDPLDGNASFDCHVSGADYDCDDRNVIVTNDEGYDASLHVSVSASGTFASPTSASGSQTADVACNGSDCGLAESFFMVSFPCRTSVDFEADHRGD